MKKLLYTLAALLMSNLVLAQTQTENYIKSTTPKVAVQSETALNNLSADDKIESITYFDGLGRAKQSIALRAGGDGEDIITPFVYDEFGRQIRDYLPYARSTSSLNFLDNTSVISGIENQYLAKFPNDVSGATPNVFSEKHLESSPLNRVLEQGAPGTDWAVNKTSDADHTIKFEYGANLASEVLNFKVDFIGGDTENPKLTFTNTYYNSGELYKTVTKDENWRSYDTKDRTTEEFKNKIGQVILKRTFNNQQPHDTHYVYDDFGNLTYVLPPLASQKAIFYDLSMLNIPASSLVTGGNPTGDISIGIEQTGVNTYQFKGDIDLHNLGNSTFINGEIIDIPNLDPSLGSYINLGGIFQYDFINGIEYERYVQYYISNGKLYCSSGSYSYNNITDEDGEDVSAAGFPDITDIDQTKTIGLPDTLEGITEVETQANIQELLDNLCYQYKYDNRNRLIEKKIPGKGWEYIVYDNLNRPALTQDANLLAVNNPNSSVNQWLFTKYDVFGRVIITGLYNSNSSREALQTIFNNVTNASGNYEIKADDSTGDAGTYYYIDNFPSGGLEILTVNYYDDYTFNTDSQTLPASWDGQAIINYNNSSTTKKLTKGLATGSRVRVLGTNDWITTITGYDVKGRPIYVMSKNSYLGTSDVVKNTLDFIGALDKSVTEHNKGANNIITEDVLTYDHIGRLTKQTQELNNTNALEVIAENHYDELGQLESKGVGGSNTNTNRLQNVDYTYNIRGWLKKINDPFQALGTDLFSMKLSYNDAGTRLYNGNISQQTWKTANDNISRTYNYKYDDLNRITSASDGWFWLSRFPISVTYDKNGNIISLYRKGAIVENPNISNSSDYGTMDNLTYDYDGNQLLSVTDSGNTTYGFKDGNTSGDDYTYDANGNMTKDLNKGIGTSSVNGITYNHLNLPVQVKFNNSNTQKINYIYDATGVKLEKKVTEGSTITNTLYAGNYIYENTGSGNELKFFSHPEGYVEPNGGSFDYVYQYKDHLGNIRLSYKDISTNSTPVLEIIEENNYYPFGLQHKGYNNVVSSNSNSVASKYKYNGKEHQEELGLDWYDYGARNYDASLGRWMNLDPLAEKYLKTSPYTYAINNPILFIDPDGMQIEYANDPDKTRKENRQARRKFKKNQRELNRSSSTARKQWRTLKRSKNIHTIHINENDENGKRKSFETVQKKGYTEGVGGGTDIFVDLDDTTVEGVDEGSPISQIAHEQAHAVRFDQGLAADGPSTSVSIGTNLDDYMRKLPDFINSDREVEERAATQTTNTIRKEIDPSGETFKVRTKYTKVPIYYYNPFTKSIDIKKNKTSTIIIYPNPDEN